MSLISRINGTLQSLFKVGPQSTANIAVNLAATPGSSAYNPSWFALTDVYWDPVSGSDANSGTVGHPLLTFAEIVRRYGSPTPQLNYGQNLTIHLLSSQPAGQDPVFFSPKLSGGASFTLLGTLSLAVSFNLGAITAKNRTTGQVLKSAGFVSGSLAVGQLVSNTHAGRLSNAFIETLPGGGIATLSQPFAPFVTASPALTAEVDTWTAGDTVNVYNLPTVNWKTIAPQGGDAGGTTGNYVLQNVYVVDPVSVGDSFWGVQNVDTDIWLAECQVDPFFAFSSGGANVYAFNCNLNGGGQAGGGGGTCKFVGGIIGSFGLTMVGGSHVLDGDILLDGGIATDAGFVLCGFACLNGTTWTVSQSFTELVAGSYAGYILWGAGSALNVQAGSEMFAVAFTAHLLVSTIHVQGLANGLSRLIEGTFVANGTTQVNVSGGGGDAFPANAPISISMNTIGGTPGAVFFSATPGANTFHVKSISTDTSTYNWAALPTSVACTAANIDLYHTIMGISDGSKFTIV